MTRILQIINEVPGCIKKVERKNIFEWVTWWRPKKEVDEFPCKTGKRNVRLSPNLIQAKVTVEGCHGCEHFRG